MPADTAPVSDNTIRLSQELDAAGRPAPAEFFYQVHHTTANTLGSDAMIFLAPLNPRETATPGVFTYTDPQRGSGTARLEGFSLIDAQRIQELVRMQAIEAAVGPEPLKNPDLELGNALVLRSNNPWFFLVFGLIVLGFAIWLLSAAAGVGDKGAVYTTMGIILGAGSIVLFVIAAIRAPWWRKARAEARKDGGPLPPDLTGL
ncbi:MAG: hypothetical protein ABWY54_06100 [Glaciihabitans sp.]